MLQWARRSRSLGLLSFLGFSLVLVLCGCQRSLLGGEQARSIRGNEKNDDYRSAKKQLYDSLEETRRTFYCDCAYKGRAVAQETCPVSSKRFKERIRRTEVEHVVPASRLGQLERAWQVGHPRCVSKRGKSFKGRKCALLVSEDFRRMHSDLFNLHVVVGAVNALRGNRSIGMLDGEKRLYGACDVEFEGTVFEPRTEIRGDIARIYFYMEAAYPSRLKLTASERRLLKAWHLSDPVSQEELAHVKRLTLIQGNTNPFVLDNRLPRWF